MKKPYASMPEPSRLSSHALPAEPLLRRCREIKPAYRLGAYLLLAVLLPVGTLGATPAPHPSGTKGPVRIDVTKVQPKSLLPKRPEHTEFTVEINKLGQVTRVRSQRASDNPTFNAQTYGNALQAFIRTPDGHVILGTYKLTYDFDPKTARVRRDVTLVRQGGVDGNAKGAADVLMEEARNHPPGPNVAPRPQESVDPRSLPDLKSVIVPTAEPSPN